jgi:hypothetical protein
MIPILVSPKKACSHELLDIQPTTENERKLQAALEVSMAENSTQRKQIISMQSAAVLNGAYCDLICVQLAAQEESKRKQQKGRLVGDGLPRLLSSRNFVQRVIEFHEKGVAAADALEKRKVNRKERAEAMKEWKSLEDTRKTENLKIQAQWKIDMGLWEKERDLAKGEKRRARWNKPILKGLLFSPVPKPQLTVDEDVEKSDSERDSDSSDSSSDAD